MVTELPPELTVGAILRGNEYGWTLSSFPAALATADKLGFACLGGQLQFQLESSICEAYWLGADASPRMAGEFWRDYVRRSCDEVREKFTSLVRDLDVQKLIHEWTDLPALLAAVDPQTVLFFVGYFLTEAEYMAV